MHKPIGLSLRRLGALALELWARVARRARLPDATGAPRAHGCFLLAE